MSFIETEEQANEVVTTFIARIKAEGFNPIAHLHFELVRVLLLCIELNLKVPVERFDRMTKEEIWFYNDPPIKPTKIPECYA